MIWYQGESDANAQAAPLYTGRMKRFLAAVRRDTGNARLPVAVVQLSRVIGRGADAARHWNSIQDQQRRLALTISRVAVVPAIDLELEDPIHIGADVNRLGRRLAQAMHALMGGKDTGPLPLEVDNVRLEVNPANSQVEVVVSYRNVAGQLRAAGRPVGFAFTDNFEVRELVYAVEVAGREARIRSALNTVSMESLRLHYGLGTNPVCNITDALDRAAPVFGPVMIGQPRALTQFARRLRVSAPVLLGDTRPTLVHPNEVPGLVWETRQFSGTFCDRHAELSALAPRHGAVYYACALDVPEPMRLAALLGYDGPVRLWVDGQERFADPHGKNPAILDSARIVLELKPGRHEVAIGLDINQGKAWGIFLRFERLDVPRRLLQRGPDAYRLPEVVAS
jgi:sialate O-acetylesterase